MHFDDAWRRRASAFKSGAATRIGEAVKRGLASTASLTSEGYAAALNWKNNSELSQWLADNLSKQRSTATSRAMDADYIESHVGGGWHRIYDGGHSISGSWDAVKSVLPDAALAERAGTWANEYWKDLITARGMPIITFDSSTDVSEYLKHLDCVNVAQLVGGELSAISIYYNWHKPDALVATASATTYSGFAYANIVGPLISLIALGRAYFLVKDSEREELHRLVEPLLKGVSRSATSILLISIVPGGFLVHLSSGIVISLAHGYVWEQSATNKEAILLKISACLQALRSQIGTGSVELPAHMEPQSLSPKPLVNP